MFAALNFDGGVTRIEINGRLIEPVSFRAFWPQAHTTRAFAEGGTKLMTVFPSGILCSLKVPYSQFGEVWTGEGEYDFKALDAQIEQFISNAPDAYLSLMLMLDTRDWYLEADPDARNSFYAIARMAGDDKWRKSAARMLADILEYVQAKYPEKFYCVYVCAGGTCEWINTAPPDAADPRANEAFARFTGREGARVPDERALYHTSHGVFRDPVADAGALEYWRFHNQIIADAVCFFASEVKRITQRRLLVGCFFGYYFQWPADFLSFGHAAATRVISCPDIDLIFSPASYLHRGLDNVSASQLPVDAVGLNRKLYFHEIDNTTYLANGNKYAQVLQTYAHRRHASLDESIQYSRREAAFAASKGQGYWWFDMFAGWFDDERIMRALMDARDKTERLARMPRSSASEACMLVDEESLYYSGRSNRAHQELIIDQRESAGFAGFPVDEYEASDILKPDFPIDRYKLYLCMNLFAPSSALRAKIAELRARGATLVFSYAAGAITSRGFDISAASEFVGITLSETDRPMGYCVVEPGDANDDGMTRVYSGRAQSIRPALVALDDGARALGFDLTENTVLLADKPRAHGGHDVWSAFGAIPAWALRPIARRAGVHIWQSANLPIYANSNMLCLFSNRGGDVRVSTIWRSGRLTDSFTGETHALDSTGDIALSFKPNECKWFLREEDAQ